MVVFTPETIAQNNHMAQYKNIKVALIDDFIKLLPELPSKVEGYGYDKRFIDEIYEPYIQCAKYLNQRARFPGTHEQYDTIEKRFAEYHTAIMMLDSTHTYKIREMIFKATTTSL